MLPLKANMLRALSVLAVLFMTMAPLRAVVLYGTGDPTANTTAPTGTWANSGWQYVGQLSGGLDGTVIASNYFATAKHIGGNVGDTFNFNGVNYTMTASFPDPFSDLQIWRVAGTFPIHAPIFSGAAGSEVNSALVVIGRGRQRGGAVLVGNDSHLGGWLWGTSDNVQRWGTNVVGSIYTDPTYGDLLRAPFDSNAGPNEAHLSPGDSGGAVFVLNTNTNNWELAGINLAADGPFSTSASGTNSFNASMFDSTGLFVPDDAGGWTTAPNPSAFYSTEIAAHRGFIQSVVMQLNSVVSRKTHGLNGTFDVDLPETGKPGIECRSGGVNNNYTLVFTFAQNVTVQNATVSTGTGSVTSFNAVGKIVTVNLMGIVSPQRIVVKLVNVNDATNISDVQATMDVLVGDTNGDGFVDSADIGQTKSKSGQALTADNFRQDINIDGFLDSADIGFVKSKSGNALSGTLTPAAAETSIFSIKPLPTPEPKAGARSNRLRNQKSPVSSQ